MNVSSHLIERLKERGWFAHPGAYVMVDGQFGSTGKGVLASLMVEVGEQDISFVTTNAGPNSGHTAFYEGNKIMTQQLPIASVILNRKGRSVVTYLNGGAIIDMDILKRELETFDTKLVFVHPHAAVIEEEDRRAEADGSVAKIASTGKGVGAALSRKILRQSNVVENYMGGGIHSAIHNWDWNKDVVFVETAQGFSLGIHGGFYPHCTSRECTAMQAIADARIPYNKVHKVAMCLRTYPIRVGNTDKGHSGACYSDQNETTWEKIGQEPEMTTVTKRVRRVFTWSREQFKEAVAANQPHLLFLNFCNYLRDDELGPFVRQMIEDYKEVMGCPPEDVLLGFGPNASDIIPVDHLEG